MAVVTSAINVDPDLMSGVPVFAGSRVPVHILIDYLATGHSLDDFLEQFPTVTRERAIGALQELLALAVTGNDAHPAR